MLRDLFTDAFVAAALVSLVILMTVLFVGIVSFSSSFPCSKMDHFMGYLILALILLLIANFALISVVCIIRFLIDRD